MPYEILLQHASIVSCLCVFGISHFGLYYLYSSTRVFQERPNKQNVLQFEFDADQSRLLSVIQDIESLKVKYGGMEGLRNK